MPHPKFGKIPPPTPTPNSIFLSNRSILSATFLTFQADNKCDFERIFDILRYFSALLSSISSTFWAHNSCDFDFFFPWKTWKYAIFSSNCAFLSAIFSTFLADNKRIKVFLIFFQKTGDNAQNNIKRFGKGTR